MAVREKLGAERLKVVFPGLRDEDTRLSWALVKSMFRVKTWVFIVLQGVTGARDPPFSLIFCSPLLPSPRLFLATLHPRRHFSSDRRRLPVACNEPAALLVPAPWYQRLPIHPRLRGACDWRSCWRRNRRLHRRPALQAVVQEVWPNGGQPLLDHDRCLPTQSRHSWLIGNHLPPSHMRCRALCPTHDRAHREPHSTFHATPSPLPYRASEPA